MNANEIRRIVNTRPFQPLLFHLDNGKKQLVNHPEILITEIMIISVDDDGLPIYIAPEAISVIKPAPRGKRVRRQNRRTTSRR